EVLAPATYSVAGDTTLLTVLLRNLIDNAIRYSPPSARILLRLDELADHVVLTIEDSGPGMSEADLKRVGERFFRVIGTGESGSGLGWSIVQRIAQVHHASVKVTRSPTLGGLQVSIRWPIKR
ncbi:MAG TPA: ATP-binding protein, partial [Aquabacterium sp.]|nr:ATP-binding protein [Aquabacterium sp.]